MKFKLLYILPITLIALMTSCKKDNYDEPTSKLSGRIVYQGQSLGFENSQVPYELYQFGFGKVGPIGASFAQDGSYSALLFDGQYKLIIPNGQGPFLWPKTASGAPDTLLINLKGNTQLDIEVTPYYMIRNAAYSASGNAVTANFGVEKIVTDPAMARDIERVALFINKTQFVSSAGVNRIADAGINGSAIADPSQISLSVNIPSITPTQNYVFARVGVKVAGVEDWLYGPLEKLTY
jgi:hypothetical protein